MAAGDPLVDEGVEGREQVDTDALVAAGLENVGEGVPVDLQAVVGGRVVTRVDLWACREAWRPSR